MHITHHEHHVMASKKKETETSPKGKRVETTVVVQGVVVETLEYDDGMLIETAQHLHCLRFLDLQLNYVGTRRYTGQNVDSFR